ncbi:50S ribosomal protein L24 [Malacoplasma iowae]|uniref:50S ribosomal protein L24 n=1 Tax=Malacoplasma iowae TaxID=2116 RepID=UPI002A18B1DD|nr:50S ribosomal protein L24 [Malacoplasma iowae]WPL37591.1 50S ribosomal protein L24 [Malacoplasma iowae]
MQRLKKGDRVRVISGKETGKEGTILQVFPKLDKAIVEGVNIVKKHQKPNHQKEEGGILEKQLPIHLCKLALVEPKAKTKITKVRFGYDKNNKKVRIAKATNSEIGKK